MDADDLKKRTKLFALRILKLVSALPNNVPGRTVAGQLVRSGTSVGSNYRAACRGRSRAEFVAKLGLVEEEADETIYWMELLEESELIHASKVEKPKKEVNEILSIIVASIKTVKAHTSPIVNPKS